jgi:hypothetical protein
MARITWLGDAECKWNDVVFPPGTPVETDDNYMIGKARTNPFFRLDEGVPRPQGTVYGPYPEMWTEPIDHPPGDVFGDPIPALQEPTKRKRGRPPKVRPNVDQ